MEVTRIYLRIKCDRELGVLRSQLWRALNALHRHLKLCFVSSFRQCRGNKTCIGVRCADVYVKGV